MYITAFTRPHRCQSQPLEYSSVPQCLAYKPSDATFINSVAIRQLTYRQLTRKMGQEQQIFPGNTQKGKVLGEEMGQFYTQAPETVDCGHAQFQQERFSVVARVSKKNLPLMQERWLPRKSGTTQEAKMRLQCSYLLLGIIKETEIMSETYRYTI